MDILSYINRMNQIYGSGQQAAPVYNTQKYLQGGRVGYKRGSTIAMQKPVEFYVDIIKNMIKDSKYVPPVNINAREVGTIPNFKKAKELVKAETGESFDVLYNRNVQKRKKIKRASDPIKKEKDIIAKAERKGKRRVLKADPSDPVKMTDREQALNFEQRKYNRDLNLKIRQNPDLILKDKALMDKLSTTVSKDGNIIKVKPTLDDIKNRGIIELDHQRDIYKTGKLKNLPYNRNFILGPYNREGGFKKMAETFIEKNPDVNNIKVKNIIKKAEELGVTLQPNVAEGTFPTKSIGYKQVGGPVEKFANAAAHSFEGSTFGSKLNLSPKKSVIDSKGALGKTGRFLFGPVEMGLLPLAVAAEGLYANYADKKDLKKALEQIDMPQEQKDAILEGFRQEARDIGGVGLETYAINQPNVKDQLAEQYKGTEGKIKLTQDARAGINIVREQDAEAKKLKKQEIEKRTKEAYENAIGRGSKRPIQFNKGGLAGYDDYLPDMEGIE